MKRERSRDGKEPGRVAELPPATPKPGSTNTPQSGKEFSRSQPPRPDPSTGEGRGGGRAAVSPPCPPPVPAVSLPCPPGAGQCPPRATGHPQPLCLTLAWPGHVPSLPPSLLQRDLRRGNSAALKGVSNAQPKLGSAQSQTGSSKPSPAPGAARNACPAQPGASGQTEQTKPNHTFHKINPLLLLFL